MPEADVDRIAGKEQSILLKNRGSQKAGLDAKKGSSPMGYIDNAVMPKINTVFVRSVIYYSLPSSIG
jgi:hypothetical protein